MFLILFEIFKSQPYTWRNEIAEQNHLLTLFTESFSDVLEKKLTMEEARDILRSELNRNDPESFPQNSSKGTDIFSLYIK